MDSYNPGNQHSVNVTGTSAPFVGGNPKRRTLAISSHPTARVTLSANPPVVDMVGVIIHPATRVTVLRYEDYGEWLCRPLHAISDGGTPEVVYVETESP